MANIDLKKYGIKGVKEILYNPTYEVLYNEETKPGLEGFDKGQVTELGPRKASPVKSGGPPRVIPTTTTRCP